MEKKKREHVTFDRMAEKRIRINKKAFTNKKIYKNSVKSPYGALNQD